MNKVIYDTDISPHVSDAAGLALLHVLARRGEIEHLAVMLGSSQRDGVPVISILAGYYGQQIPVGALAEENFLNFSMNRRYSRHLVAAYGENGRPSGPRRPPRSTARPWRPSPTRASPSFAAGPTAI